MSTDLTPPEPRWNDRTKALYADWFVDCYYFESADNEHHPRRSEADAYEEWKPVAAALGVWRAQELEIPDDVQEMIAQRYMAKGETFRKENDT